MILAPAVAEAAITGNKKPLAKILLGGIASLVSGWFGRRAAKPIPPAFEGVQNLGATMASDVRIYGKKVTLKPSTETDIAQFHGRFEVNGDGENFVEDYTGEAVEIEIWEPEGTTGNLVGFYVDKSGNMSDEVLLTKLAFTDDVPPIPPAFFSTISLGLKAV